MRGFRRQVNLKIADWFFQDSIVFPLFWLVSGYWYPGTRSRGKVCQRETWRTPTINSGRKMRPTRISITCSNFWSLEILLWERHHFSSDMLMIRSLQHSCQQWESISKWRLFFATTSESSCRFGIQVSLNMICLFSFRCVLIFSKIWLTDFFSSRPRKIPDNNNCILSRSNGIYSDVWHYERGVFSSGSRLVRFRVL